MHKELILFVISANSRHFNAN